MARHFWDYWDEGFEFEEWDELAQDEYRAYCELKREERRENRLYDDLQEGRDDD